MTRILACSDIHNSVSAARKLRAREGNDYDAVIVAGDIGTQAAQEVMDVLRTFECPVLYVLGNWDHGISHQHDFGAECHHLHLSPSRVGDLSVIGETVDGVDPAWEAVKADVEKSNPDRLAAVREEYFKRQRALLTKMVVHEGPARTVVVTHYRLSKTSGFLPGVPLFLYGHRHGFTDTTYLGQRFVNVSALDNKVTVLRRGLNRVRPGDYRFINDGTYVVLTHDSRGLSVEPRRFDPDFSEWTRIEKEFYSWATEVEEAESGSEVDPALHALKRRQ